ncbi:aminopeptidase N [Shewanella sp. NIFS-20-20]|uniref:aminopeptidase N n=1 Tax=Shewanella sp. NIFS-20-20 TaxID=2853806 RepID=UPI001C46F53C|nr:aminopeptidase N [Shewanella sp. NIFS-20-20]MBV7314611.1 aminopeptidase N [Shewanella sp. NIFS-20-20]
MSQAQAKYLKDYQTPDFTITHLDLDIYLDGDKTQVVATSQVVRKNPNAMELILDGEGLTLVEVSCNGQSIDYQAADNQLRLSTDLAEFTLKVVTKLDPESNSSLEGLYLSDGAYCTQCEAEGFRRITYFLDRPDVLARYDVRIDAPQSLPYLLSNGNLLEKGQLANGRHFAKWQDPFPKPSYLFALVAGDFDLLEDKFVTKSGRNVVLQVFVDKGNLHKAEHAMTSLKKSMAWDEQRFNLEYDLDIYMIVAVDFFNMGAMENKGLNVFNTKYVLADNNTATDDDYHGIESVVGHEYFHNWTGNRVTCRDWFQLSLKEGLTVFRDQEFSSDIGSRPVNRIHAIRVIKNQQFAEDAGPMSHPIRPDSVIEMNNFYTVTVYNKGAEVIRMMHTLLGEQHFQAGMALYVERFDGQAVTCDDFVGAMSDASGIDLTQFSAWYRQAGTPLLQVSDSYCAKSHTYRLDIQQSIPNQAQAEVLHIPFSLELLDAEGKSLVNTVLDIKQAQQSFEFTEISAPPVASLLQDFSAPVRLEYQYTNAQLAHLLMHASSQVARWEASVTMFSRAIWDNVDRLANQQPMSLESQVCDALRGVILDQDIDAALLAEILNFPSLNVLIEQVESVNLEHLIAARFFVLEQLIIALEDELLACMRAASFNDTPGARALKNACLLHLAKFSDDAELLVESQYQQAASMTDTLGALTAANQAELDCRHALMCDFESKWKETPLVMDKWFMLQATNPSDQVISQLQGLLSHQAFSINNPNRVRSLIGTFAAANTERFHAADGSGYQFLTEQLVKLDKINPQTAARLITPLIQYARFDSRRQQLIRACLTELSRLPELSRDLFEKISRALDA